MFFCVFCFVVVLLTSNESGTDFFSFFFFYQPIKSCLKWYNNCQDTGSMLTSCPTGQSLGRLLKGLRQKGSWANRFSFSFRDWVFRSNLPDWQQRPLQATEQSRRESLSPLHKYSWTRGEKWHCVICTTTLKFKNYMKKQGLSPCVVKYPSLCVWYRYCKLLLLLVYYMSTLFALGLIIRTLTHLVWFS